QLCSARFRARALGRQDCEIRRQGTGPGTREEGLWLDRRSRACNQMTTLATYLSVLPESAHVKVEEREGNLYVSVPQGQDVTLVEKYQSRSAEPYSTQTKTIVSIAPNSRVTHYKVVLEGMQATHQSFMEVEAAKDAAFYSHVFLMGGASIRNTIH